MVQAEGDPLDLVRPATVRSDAIYEFVDRRDVVVQFPDVSQHAPAALASQGLEQFVQRPPSTAAIRRFVTGHGRTYQILPRPGRASSLMHQPSFVQSARRFPSVDGRSARRRIVSLPRRIRFESACRVIPISAASSSRDASLGVAK